METRISLKYFANGGLWEHFFAFNLAQTSSNVIFFDNFGNSKAFQTVLT